MLLEKRRVDVSGKSYNLLPFIIEKTAKFLWRNSLQNKVYSTCFQNKMYLYSNKFIFVDSYFKIIGPIISEYAENCFIEELSIRMENITQK